MLDAQTKTCHRCHEEKPISEFARNSSQKDGHHVRCRSCESAYQKERRAARKLAADESAEMHDLGGAESELDLEPA